MKNTIKGLLATALIAFLLAPASAQVRLGLRAAMNLATVDVSLPQENPPDYRLGFHVGGLVEMPVYDAVSVGSGLIVQSKGYKNSKNIEGELFTFELRPTYLQVPLQLILRDKGIFAAVGPYAAIGVGGQTVLKSSTNNASKMKETINFGNDKSDNLGRYDFGATVEVGYEWKMGLRFTFMYQAGLNDLRPDGVDKTLVPAFRNRVAAVGVTYVIGLKGPAN